MRVSTKRLPEGYRRRLLTGSFSVLFFSLFFIGFVFILNIQSTTIQPYIVINQTGTDEVTAIKSILVHKGRGQEVNGKQASIMEYTCHKDSYEIGRYNY